MSPPASPNAAAPILSVKALSAGYGKLPVLHGLSLDIAPGAMVAIIGPNGAGKSTFAKALMKGVDIFGGEVHFKGARIDGLETQAIAARGVGYVPQTGNVFVNLTVRENLELSCNLLTRGSPARAVEGVFERFPRLRERAGQKGGYLSGGERQMLAIGSALIAEPDLVILDEPTSGLSPSLIKEVSAGIRAISASGRTVIWIVEENPREVLALAHWACVLDGGTLRMSCPAREILEAPNFRELFLGV
ncbi:ABC transporter ATP-binding protein [Ancylobacter sp. SL191]|uniref:ABC transporter ATP-binding protein n=1 Tax=Ancylobacter sp. SL191 TaxID=2995166 RepID=UPI00226E3C71|nr:ABC transporter ATP-binding protein [Ancylobacter sp. SL191]WAC25616.1 ABC transporter ATP-binding protein [Ancylobacter sp. SL191]